MPATPTPDYGLDAPGAVRNLFIAAAVGILVFGSVKAHLWSGTVTLRPFVFQLARMGLGVFLVAGFMGAWMFLDSKYGKVRERERVLSLLTWTGRERATARHRPDENTSIDQKSTMLLKPPTLMRFMSKGEFLGSHIAAMRGSFMTLAVTLLRWALFLYTIHENSTVSPGLDLASLVKGIPKVVFKSSPTHSW